MLSSSGRGSSRLDVGGETDAGSNGRLANSSFWRAWGSSRRVRLFAALSLVAVVLAAAVADVAVPAHAASQRGPVTGVTAQPGDNPGELIIAWDAHPDGANDYRVALAPADGEYSPYGNRTWNAYPAGATVTFSDLVPDAEYKLKVRARFKPAVSGAKRSAWSQEASATAAAAAETLPGEPPSDDGTSSNSVGSQSGEDKSTSVPDGPEPEPEPGIGTRDHTSTSTTIGRSPDNPFVLTLRAGNSRTLDPLYEPPTEEVTLTFRQNPAYQYSESSFSLTTGDAGAKKKHYSSFTLTNAASVKIVVSEQTHAGAKLSLYVGQDEHRIVKHADRHGRNGNKFEDSILFVDLQPGTYGIRLQQPTTMYNPVTMKFLAIPIEPQSDAATSNGGIWTNVYTGNWLSLEEMNSSVAALGMIGSGSNLSDVSDWWHFDAIPTVTTSTEDADVTLDSLLQITVSSVYGAWFLLWNSDGKSIGYGLANARTATAYKWASDLLAEDGDVYIEIRPTPAALNSAATNDYRIYVTVLYEACTETIGGLTTVVAFECN